MNIVDINGSNQSLRNWHWKRALRHSLVATRSSCRGHLALSLDQMLLHQTSRESMFIITDLWCVSTDVMICDMSWSLSSGSFWIDDNLWFCLDLLLSVLITSIKCSYGGFLKNMPSPISNHPFLDGSPRESSGDLQQDARLEGNMA